MLDTKSADGVKGRLPSPDGRLNQSKTEERMNITKKDFLKEVRVEIGSIKRHATPIEIGKLDFKRLNPINTADCIYGQMTDNCFSDRAKDLIRKCKLSLRAESVGNGTFNYSEYAEAVEKKSPVYREKHGSIFRDFTPLELYITLKGAKNEDVIAYLKGEKRTLKL